MIEAELQSGYHVRLQPGLLASLAPLIRLLMQRQQDVRAWSRRSFVQPATQRFSIEVRPLPSANLLRIRRINRILGSLA
jgi:hypothetical protein